MDYTVLELLNRVVHYKKKEYDFYQENLNWDLEDYLKTITSISPEEKYIISSDCHEEPLSKTISMNRIADKVVNVDGIMIYSHILHDDDYDFEKIKDYNELYDTMKLLLNNGFYCSLIVFVDGEQKDYCVKDEDGQILHRDYDKDWLQKFEQMRIEWL